MCSNIKLYEITGPTALAIIFGNFLGLTSSWWSTTCSRHIDCVVSVNGRGRIPWSTLKDFETSWDRLTCDNTNVRHLSMHSGLSFTMSMRSICPWGHRQHRCAIRRSSWNTSSVSHGTNHCPTLPRRITKRWNDIPHGPLNTSFKEVSIGQIRMNLIVNGWSGTTGAPNPIRYWWRSTSWLWPT